MTPVAPIRQLADLRKRAKQLRKVAREFNIDAAVQDADWLNAYATLLEQQQTRTCETCAKVRDYVNDWARTDIVAEVVLTILDGRDEDEEPRP